MKLAILLALALPALEAQTIEVRQFSQLAALDGEWKITTGDDPRFAAPDFDDSAWRTVRVPQEEISGSWIRFKVQLPDGPLPAEPFALLLPPLGTSYDLFVNGQWVGSFGDPRMTNGWGDRYTPAAAAYAIPLPARSFHIAIRTRRLVPTNAVDPAARSAWIGTNTAIAAKLRQVELEVRWRTAGHLMAISATTMAGLFFVLLPLWRADAREFLWCGAFLLVITVLRPQSVAPWVFEGYPLPLVMTWLFAFLVPYQLCWERLFRLLFDVRLSRWGRLCHQGVMMLTAALCVLSPWLTTSIAPFFALHVLLILVMMISAYCDLARQSPSVDETPWMHLAVTLFHGGNVVYFFLFGFVPVSSNVQNLVFIVRAGGSLMFAGVMTLVLNRRSARLQREQQRLAQEMRAGAEMQALLLPAGSIEVPGIKTEAAYLPMSEVGGDFHYALTDGASLIIVAGDVSGKGLPAALLVAAVIGILRNTAERRPGALLAALNRALHGQTRGGFVTCCCARFDPDGTVTLANAGHLAPYADGEEVAAEGLPLGLVADVDYEEKSLRASAMTFVSDGVVEAENAQRELFGFDRTREISGKSAQEIAEAAKAWGQNDDITVVTVQRKT